MKIIFTKGSSGSGEIKCPNCGDDDCFEEVWYRAGEQLISCFDCGYQYKFFWKRDDNGKLILKDSGKEETEDNMIPEVEETFRPYGAFFLKNVHEFTISGKLKDAKEYEEIREDIIKEDPKSNVTDAVIYRFIKNEIITEKLK